MKSLEAVAPAGTAGWGARHSVLLPHPALPHTFPFCSLPQPPTQAWLLCHPLPCRLGGFHIDLTPRAPSSVAAIIFSDWLAGAQKTGLWFFINFAILTFVVISPIDSFWVFQVYNYLIFQ